MTSKVSQFTEKLNLKHFSFNNLSEQELGNLKPTETVWPSNGGALGEWRIKTLEPGELIDRYGFPGGKHVSPKGVAFEQRALPPDTNLTNYHVYEVVNLFQVEESIVAPWFGQPGGGIQYRLNESVKELLDYNFLREIE
ncbi:TNT domain-containing protein [Actinomyces vulturis]|uniref:TNT domain-containing protein n=1 Tax=Actinomyces vulturis TaxID=1857645 RepID=UPI00083089AF|nr:TNT domain-containing protein [Actinomyces vulturis]